MARLLAEHAEIDGVWTSNDVMAFGALEALAAAGRTAKVVGVNGLPEAIDNIERGTMQASVDFSAFNIAGIAARAALRHLRGEAVPAGIMVPAALIDRTNFQREGPFLRRLEEKVPFAERPSTPLWEEIVRGLTDLCARDMRQPASCDRTCAITVCPWQRCLAPRSRRRWPRHRPAPPPAATC